jgi:hypothetical protein
METIMIEYRRSAPALLGCVLATLVAASAPACLFAGESAVEDEANRILENSMTYLSGLPKFSLAAHSSIEAVLDSGQKIQFDNISLLAVKRPNKLYAMRLGDLVGQTFYYDGATLTLHDADNGMFATVEAPDTLDGMLDFMRDSLDIVAPGADFIYSNAYELLMEDVESGFVVGPSVVEGVVCDHLAFSKPGTDFQVWIARSEQPLPMKLVITSRDVMNAPQFSVVLREWDLASEFADEKFAFEPPGDAQAIEFTVLEPESD